MTSTLNRVPPNTEPNVAATLFDDTKFPGGDTAGGRVSCRNENIVSRSCCCVLVKLSRLARSLSD